MRLSILLGILFSIILWTVCFGFSVAEPNLKNPMRLVWFVGCPTIFIVCSIWTEALR